MRAKPAIICVVMTLAAAGVTAAVGAPAPGAGTSGAASAASPKLTAAQIVDRNVAARGGLEAWRAVRTLSLEGKMGVGGNQRAALMTPAPPRQGGPRRASAQPDTKVGSPRRVDEVKVPFLMQLERSRKVRFELQFNGKTAVQVYDGSKGWKVRPYLNRNDVEPFSAEESKLAAEQSELDGYLVDYAAKGTKVELVDTEKVENRDNYKLKLTLKSGRTLHVWIDAQSFLETKMEGSPRRLDGVYHPVEVYYRDYRNVSGLQVPFVLETKVLPVGRTAIGFSDPPVPVEKVTMEKVVVNPPIDESRFSKPEVMAAAPIAAAQAAR